MDFKKKDGTIESFLTIGIITFGVVFVLFLIKSKEISIMSDYVSDGLVASNLAAATVDLKTYGTSNKIVNNDFEKSYVEYSESLKMNLNLDDNLKPLQNNMINSNVVISTFAIYNVEGNDVYMTKREDGGIIQNQKYTNGLGSVKTPEGVVVESTTIYSKIGFELKGYLKQTQYAYKENSVDVTDKK